MTWHLLQIAIVLFILLNMALALGSTCSTPLGDGTAAAGAPFWLQNITHQGTSTFNHDPSNYQMFRNVKDFGVVGNGLTDDTVDKESLLIDKAVTNGGHNSKAGRLDTDCWTVGCMHTLYKGGRRD